MVDADGSRQAALGAVYVISIYVVLYGDLYVTLILEPRMERAIDVRSFELGEGEPPDPLVRDSLGVRVVNWIIVLVPIWLPLVVLWAAFSGSNVGANVLTLIMVVGIIGFAVAIGAAIFILARDEMAHLRVKADPQAAPQDRLEDDTRPNAAGSTVQVPMVAAAPVAGAVLSSRTERPDDLSVPDPELGTQVSTGLVMRAVSELVGGALIQLTGRQRLWDVESDPWREFGPGTRLTVRQVTPLPTWRIDQQPYTLQLDLPDGTRIQLDVDSGSELVAVVEPEALPTSETT